MNEKDGEVYVLQRRSSQALARRLSNHTIRSIPTGSVPAPCQPCTCPRDHCIPENTPSSCAARASSSRATRSSSMRHYSTALFAGTRMVCEAVHGDRWDPRGHAPTRSASLQDRPDVPRRPGYRIMPLADNWMPAYMSHEAGLKNSLEHAQFYAPVRLAGLLERTANNAAFRKAMSRNVEEE